MSSRQGKGCQEMPITQTEPVQYLHDFQSDRDQDFDITTVNPNAESTRMDCTHSCPRDGHVPHHVKPKANSVDQHMHQGVPGNLQGPTSGIATVQPAERTKSGTSEMNWTKHEETHKVCWMTSEN